MNIYAIYRDGDTFKFIIDNKGSKYEANVSKLEGNVFNIIVNNSSLIKSDETQAIESLRIILALIKEFLTNLYGNIEIKYSILGKEVPSKTENRLTSFHESIYTQDKFVEEFEDKDLRMERYYHKQRQKVLSWEEYFMALAQLTSLRSKDPSTQVGACIVGADNRILSIGYNGAPLGIDDDIFPWDRNGESIHTKYMYVCHAEMNAIMNYRGSRKDFEGSTVYVDLFPCNECAKLIIQAGIKHVVYLSDKYSNTEGNIASKRLFDLAGVSYQQLDTSKTETITLSLNPKDK